MGRGQEQAIETRVEAWKGGRRQAVARRLTFNGKELRAAGDDGQKFLARVKDLQAVKTETDKVILASGPLQFHLPFAGSGAAGRNEILAFKRAVDAAREEAKGGGGGGSGGFNPIDNMRSPTLGGIGSNRGKLHEKTAGKKVQKLGAFAAALANSPPRPARHAQPATAKPPPPPASASSSSSSSSSSAATAAGAKPPQQQQRQPKPEPEPEPSFSSPLPVLDSRCSSADALLKESGPVFEDDDDDDDDNNLFGRGQPHPSRQQQQQQKQPLGPSNSTSAGAPRSTQRPAFPRKQYGAANNNSNNGSKPGRASFPPLGPSSSSSSSSSLLSPRPATAFAAASTTTSSGGKREGLRNLGNTCYLNATVQALAAAAGFGDDLLSAFWLKETRADLLLPPAATLKGPPRPLRVYGSLVGLLLRLRSKGHGVLDPSLFRQAMAACFPPYGSLHQQDAHEFLGDLLNKLQEELFPYARRHAARRLLALQAQRAREREEREREEAAKEKAAAAATKAAAAAAAAAGKKGKKGQPQQAGGGEQGGGGQMSIRSFFTRTRSIDPHAEAAAGATGAAGATEVVLEETISEEEAAVLEQVLPVTRHFHSEVEKTLTCVGADCRYSRSYLEPYTDFSVDLVDPAASSNGGGDNEAAALLAAALAEQEDGGDGGGIPLQAFDLLAHCFQEQELELACERCQKQNRVRVSYRFRRLPHLLVLHLKRFKVVGATAAGGLAHQKLQTRIMAPARLDVAALCDEFTLNPRDVCVGKGLGGAAAPEETAPLVEALCPPLPSAAARGDGDASLSSSSSSSRTPPVGGGGGGGKLDGYFGSSKGGAGAGAGAGARPGLEPPKMGVWDRLRKRKDGGKEAVAGDGEEDRWAQEEAREAGGSGGGGKKRKSGDGGGAAGVVEVMDLVGDAAGGGSQEDAALQEALRRSMADQKALQEAQAKAGAGAAPVVIDIEEAASSSSAMVIDVEQEEEEDKENQRPRTANANANAACSSGRSGSSGSSSAGAAMPVLDLRQLTARSGQGGKRAPRQGDLLSSYELRSVVRHLGRSANSGHYITDVREVTKGGGSGGSGKRVTWRRHDDSVVSHLADGDRILEDDRSLQTGYIFLYTSVPPS